MKIAYAFRRAVSYPDMGGDSLRLPEGDARSRFLKHVSRVGFDGLELGLEAVGGTEVPPGSRADELRRELEDHGVPCVAVRGGGGYHDPRTAAREQGGHREGWWKWLRGLEPR